jgi:multicomponent K+:H+ antiporter subunit E
MKRWLPHPRLSLVLWALWLVLARSLGPGQMLLGAVVAVALPIALRRVIPDLPPVRRPLAFAAYLALVTWDILVSNVRVAKLALGPRSALRPAIVVVPLDIDDPVVASILAATVTLTPGTISVELDTAARRLVVHGIDVPDAEALVGEIKQRYERRLICAFGKRRPQFRRSD